MQYSPADSACHVFGRVSLVSRVESLASAVDMVESRPSKTYASLLTHYSRDCFQPKDTNFKVQRLLLTPPTMFPTPQILSSALSKLSTPFRRSQLGLFHGKTKQYGNNVPHSKHKTRRTWLPNVHTKRLMSDALGRDLKVKLTTRALKSINKVRFVACVFMFCGFSFSLFGSSMVELIITSCGLNPICWVWKGCVSGSWYANG